MINFFIREESGQGMVEYGLILIVIAIGVIGALKLLAENAITPIYEKIEKSIPAAS